jgi:long-subunit fatty acid transport protein
MRCLALFIVLGWGIVQAQANLYDALDIFTPEKGFGVRAISLGGAYSALADDHAALFWNPAGLFRLRKVEVSAGFYYAQAPVSVRYNGVEQSEEAQIAMLEHISVAYPYPVFRGSMVFSAAYFRSADYHRERRFGAFDASDNDFQISYRLNDGSEIPPFTMRNVVRSEMISESGGLDNFALGAALQFLPELALGVQATWQTGDYRSEIGFRQVDTENRYNDMSLGQDIAEVDGRKLFAYQIERIIIGLGLQYILDKNWQFGLSYRYDVFANVQLDYTFTSNLLFDDASRLPNNQFDTFSESVRYRLPAQFMFGAAYKWSRFLLSGQVEFRDWAALSAQTDTTFSGDEAGFRLATRVRLGAEYRLRTVGLAGRIGLALRNNPVNGYYASAWLPTYHFGLSYLFTGALGADFAFSYEQSSYESPGDDILPNPAAVNAAKFGLHLALSYRF